MQNTRVLRKPTNGVKLDTLGSVSSSLLIMFNCLGTLKALDTIGNYSK